MQFSTFSLVATAVLAAALVAAQGKIVVATLDALTTCIPNRLTWTGGVAPYNVYIIVPLQPQTRLDTVGTTNENSIVYTPNGKTSGIEVGDSVAVYVSDSQGIFSGSAAIKVINGGTCSGSSSSGSGSGSSASSGSSSTTSRAPSTSTLTTSRSPTPTNSDSANTTPTSSTTSNPNTGAAAPGLKVSGGLVAGVLGLAAAALI